jgi:hypothetical protein
MEPEDVENSVIRADVAKGLAMFHVLKTSLKKLLDSPECAILCFEETIDLGSQPGSTVFVAEKCFLNTGWHTRENRGVPGCT